MPSLKILIKTPKMQILKNIAVKIQLSWKRQSRWSCDTCLKMLPKQFAKFGGYSFYRCEVIHLQSWGGPQKRPPPPLPTPGLKDSSD